VLLSLLVVLLPEHPLHLAGDVVVEDHDEAESPPPVSEPGHPQQVKQGPERHPDPFVVVYGAQVHFGIAGLFDRIDDSFKRLRVVHGEVGEDLAVQTDVLLCELAHELGVGNTILTGSCVDPLDPKSTEIALLGLAVTVSIGQTLLISVLCYGPDILSGEEISADSLENLLAASP